MSHKYVLDSCAIIAFLYGEQGKDAVKDLLNGDNEVYMHSVNVLEVYYDAIKRIESNKADLFLKWIFNDSPIKILHEITENTIRDAGYFKSAYKISLGDSFVLATAKLQNAKIISSDHHEFDIIEKQENINFLWIR
ncbi:MAG: PIN domain-containing protein [Candidatus Fibromonas sp.]|jgi:predicted nucleic acid-binding protein|nr:PIN domain-containing protein [Candidatus Fibromonas sp.]